jgi:hypothetical protein
MIVKSMTLDERDMFLSLAREIHKEFSGWPFALIVKWMTNKAERLCIARMAGAR